MALPTLLRPIILLLFDNKMKYKILILIAGLFVSVTAISQNKEVVIHKSTMAKTTDSDTYQKKEVQLTTVAVLESHSKGISVQKRKIQSDNNSEITTKNSKNKVAVPLSLMTAKQLSANNKVHNRKTEGTGTKKRHVIVPPLTAKKIEN